MPKMMGKDTTAIQRTMSGFEFSGTPGGKLGADSDEWTLINIMLDLTGSVAGEERNIETCLKAIVKDCRKSPRAENLVLRVCGFNSIDGVFEIHGFVKLMDINVDDYDKTLKAHGGTPLLDSLLNGIETLDDYGKDLDEKHDILANALLVCMTDGEENCSTIATIGTPMSANEIQFGAEKVAKRVAAIRHEEILESVNTILIGIADPKTARGKELVNDLEDIKDWANIDQFVLMTDMKKHTFAKIAGFVSQSISSSSQALHTGGPSQPIDPNSVAPIDLDDI